MSRPVYRPPVDLLDRMRAVTHKGTNLDPDGPDPDAETIEVARTRAREKARARRQQS